MNGWRIYLPVVVVNAALQAATTAPFITPGVTVGFIALAVASGVVLAASLVLVFAQAAASSQRMPVQGMPVEGLARASDPRLWFAAVSALLVVALAAVLFPPLIVLALAAVPIVLSSVALGDPWYRGFRVFARRPVSSVVRIVLTIAVIVILWVGALLAGFFLTGVLSAALTWLVFGFVAVVLARWWVSSVATTPRGS